MGLLRFNATIDVLSIAVGQFSYESVLFSSNLKKNDFFYS